MNSSEIRTRFLDFFAARGHRIVRSSSLVPANDPTLLFSNAGMNQFKDVFLGHEKRDYARACSSQKCVRAGGKHNDLEQVGRTSRHHTFFEMLGNFSFGDYFKKEAIPWAWELVTQGFAIPKDKLYVTILDDSELGPGQRLAKDVEAHEHWLGVGVPADRIFAMGPKDNFWAMGDTGPCGPCSEIHYDMGPAASDQGHIDCKFPCDCGRYVELWNLVFMQFNRDEQGAMAPLPRPSIDTGAGLERLAAALQGKLSNFDTDLFRPLIEEAAALASVEYGANHDTDVSLRIIADHARASTFLISDGVLPSNEGRGYVLRLIMRRALYHGQTLGLDEPFLYKMAGHVVQMMKGAYPELAESELRIAKAVKIEEERYAHTTREGIERFEEQAHIGYLDAGTRKFVKFADAKKRAAELAGKDPVLPGQDMFLFYGTYGLRPDFVESSLLSPYGFRPAKGEFQALMDEEKERARASWKGAEKRAASPDYLLLDEFLRNTVFEGYGQTESRDSSIVALVVKGHAVDEVKPGQEVEIVLDHTPFYAESGGQVGDVGYFAAPGSPEHVAQVIDTYRPVTGLIAHKAIARQTLRVGDLVTAVVDAERRDAIRRNHTATHLLHAALRTTLGTHVKQAGSLVAPDRLRFDFSHYAPLGEQDLLDVEDLVNQHVLKNEEVMTREMDLDSAVQTGAMALFGEKYGDRVRVVAIEDGSFSRELCGGTHVRRTGDIGLFKVVSEGSVAAGTRRIEALTGTGVLEAMRREAATLVQLSNTLRAEPEDVVQAAEKLEESEKKLRKQLEAHQLKRATSEAGDLVNRAREVKGVRVISERVEATDRNAMRQIIDSLRPKFGSGVIVLGTNTAEGNPALIAALTKDLTNRLDAAKIVKAAAAIIEGSGGGRKDLAEAGGKNPAKLDESLQAVPSIVEQML